MTSFNQSEYTISVKSCYAMLKFVYDIGSWCKTVSYLSSANVSAQIFPNLTCAYLIIVLNKGPPKSLYQMSLLENRLNTLAFNACKTLIQNLQQF